MKHRFCIFIILILAVFWRIFYLLYQAPCVTTDVSYWGLMARDIANLRHFPIWRYESLSIGSLFSYFAGFVSPIIKIDIFGLSFAELVFSFLFIFSTYYVGKSILGKTGGVIVLLLVSFAPSLLIKTATFTTGVLNIFLFLGNIMFLIAIRIWEDEDKKFYLYGIFGLISGICFWVHFYSICFIIPCVIFISFKKRVKIIEWVNFAILFFLGSLPFWVFNLKNGFLTIKNITLKPIQDILYYGAKDIFSLQLCNILNVNSFLSIKGALCLIYIAGFIYFCCRLNENLFKSKESLILLFLVFGIAIITKVSVSPALDLHPSILLYAGFSYVLAHFLINLGKKNKIICGTGILFIISLQMGDVLLNSSRINISANIALNQLISRLRYNDISYVYTVKDFAPVINFLTDGAIRADYYDMYEHMPYRFIREIKRQPAIVLNKKMQRQIVKNLKYTSAGYKKIDSGPYVIYHSFKKPREIETEIPSHNWDANSNYNNEEVKMAFDRDVGTRWTTHTRQMPDMYFQLDLKEEALIDKIVIYLAKDVSDRASGLEVKVSNDNKNWKRVVYLKDNKNILFWSGPFLLWKNYADRQEYYFKPVRARYIRFNQLRYIDDSYWSITELFIYGPSFKMPEVNYNIPELDSYLKQKKLDNIYADYWINRGEEVSRNIDLSIKPVIITENPLGIEPILRKHGIDYKKDTAGNFFIYHSLKSKNPLVPLDKKDWAGSSNIQKNGTEMAFDNNLMTRWSTDKVQSPGYYFQIDLKEEKYISGIKLWHAGSPNDWPRDIKIEFLDSDSKWKTLEYKKDFSDSLYWTGFNILVDSSRYHTYVFNPTKTKAIRCILKESNNKYYWSVHEVDLLSPVGL